MESVMVRNVPGASAAAADARSNALLADDFSRELIYRERRS